jgi:glucose-1-phosphate thymidylyltransferase
MVSILVQEKQRSLQMIGIILAGGLGSRLYPLTQSSSKQLLPVYDKPMIYYPLTTLMLAGVREIFVVVSPHQLENYQLTLKDGKQWGLDIQYLIQLQPLGIADCFNLVPKHVQNETCVVILGDNIFYGMGLGTSLKTIYSGAGALAFAYEVSKPSEYGVVVLDENENPVRIVEKPREFVSKYAIPGLYWFDSQCYHYIKDMRSSERGELEITEVLNQYLVDKSLVIQVLARGTAWLDTGTSKNLLSASNFVSVIEERQGLKIGCPEEVALREGYISNDEFERNLQLLPKGAYRSYLERIG